MQKWLIWAACLVLAIVAGMASLANSAQRHAPATAVRVPFHGGNAKSAHANAIIRRNVINSKGLLPKELPQTAVVEAREAFLMEPTDAYAIAVLGLDAASRGRTEAARKIFEADLRLGRRTLISPAWLADDAARQNDVRATLRYFDLILRRQNAASATVLAQLVQVLHQDAAVPLVVRMLRTPSPWHPQFWEAGSDDPKAIENTAKVRQRLAKFDYRNEPGLDAVLLSRLVMASKYDQAEYLYRSLRPKLAGGSKRGASGTSYSFDKTSEIEPYFWVIPDERGDLGGYLNAESKTLDISMLGGISGLVARRLASVPSGTYVIRLIPAEAPVDAKGVTVRVKLACATNPRASGTAVFKLGSGRLTSVPTTIPPGECRHFWLELSVANDGLNGLDLSLKRIDLVRASTATAVSPNNSG